MQFQFLRRDLARVLFEAAFLDRALEIGRDDLAWLDTLSATTEERYRSGAGTAAELLRTRNERDRRRDRLRTDTLTRDHLLLSVNRLLARDFDTPLPRLQLPPVASPVLYHTNLVRLALRFEPKLRLMDRELQAAEAQAAATRKTRLPDVFAGVEGRQFSRDGGFREGTFMVSVSLPWVNRDKYHSDHARDLARIEALELDRANHEWDVREEVHKLAIAIDAARREALLYRDEIIPRSQQALDSIHAAWLAGNGPFHDTLESRRLLLEAQLAFARAVATQYQTMLELVLRCGLGDLEALESNASHQDSKPTPP
jgi:outer membrane protein TolC